MCSNTRRHRIKKITLPIWALTATVTCLIAWILTFAPGYRWTPECVTVGPYGNDFLQEWVGGWMVLHGQAGQIYQPVTFDQRQHAIDITGFQWTAETYFPPVYPPPHYLTAGALAWIPYRFAVWIWLSLLGIALIAAVALCRSLAEMFSKADSNQTPLPDGWLAFVAFFPPIYFSILMGQKGTLWMFLIAMAWWLLQRRQVAMSGVIFGLLSIKPTLFFLLPIVMLRNGQWKFFGGATLTTIGLWGAAFLVLPFDVWPGFLEQLRMTGTYSSIQGYHLDWSCNLMSLAYAAQANDIFWLKTFLVAPLALYVLYELLARPANKDENTPSHWMKALVATLLLSPHAYFYDLVILAIPLLGFVKTDPKRVMMSVGLLTAATTISHECLDVFGIPLLPIVLLGMYTELCLHGRKRLSTSCSSSSLGPQTFAPSGAM